MSKIDLYFNVTKVQIKDCYYLQDKGNITFTELLYLMGGNTERSILFDIKMNDKTVIIYSSVDGHTLKICNKIKDQLLQSNPNIELFSIDDFKEDVTNYDKLIIGASIRYGVHNKIVIDFINSHKKKLDSIKTAFFSVNLVARKSEKSNPATNPYVIKFFKTIDWTPTIVEVFAGKLDYKKYPFFDRIMIQFIMWITKGPTNINTEIEYTNWEKVKKFGMQLGNM